MQVRVTPLSDALGAEISGVDLGRPLDTETVRTIRNAWLEHLVIVFRRQKMSEADQLRFCEYFGPLDKPRVPSASDQSPNVMFISNVRDMGLRTALEDGEMMFHTDRVFDEHPFMAATLYAVEVPPVGGNTLFCNCYRVYEEMPESLKAAIEGRQALNVYDYQNNMVQKTGPVGPDAPRFVHPAVRTHPETRRKAIYVNRLMTDHIVGMELAESSAVLESVFAFAEQPRFIYEHVWQISDFLMWDNRCTMHARTDFSPNHRRMMRRVAICGDRPF